MNFFYLSIFNFTNKIRSLLLEDGLITWECGKNFEIIGLIPPLSVSNKSLNNALNIILKVFNKLEREYN